MYIKAESRNINKDKSIENFDSFNRSANSSHNQTPSHSTFSHVIGSSNHSKADTHKFLREISAESKLPLKANKPKGDKNNSLQPGIISNHHFSSVSNSHSNFISPFISPSNSNLTPPSSSSSTFSYSNNNNDNGNNNTKELYSLKFLHKPQRVKQFNSARFPEEILQRNTDLNKQITLDLPPLSPKSALPTDQVDPLNNINYTINSYENYENDAFNYLNNDSSDSFLNLNTPVYKKSGELVKSSLKRRSKSLPSTPAAAAGTANGFNSNNGKQPVLLRSKSVHFDQRAPVKYFISDESPMNVYSKDEFEDMLKFNLLNKAKKLGQVAEFNNNNNKSDGNNENGDESAEEDLLIKFKKLLLEEKQHLLQRDQPVDKESVSEEEISMTKNSNDKEKPLRKSKRFQGIASKQKNPNQLDDNNTVNNNNNNNNNNDDDNDNNHDDNDNNHDDNDNSPRQIDIDRILQSRISKIPSETKITIDSLMLNNDDFSNTNNSIREIIKAKSKKKVLNKMRTNKVVGLYSQNFPILSNKNPKSLKLNIFVSLSQDKKVFLQEISLHIHQRDFMPPNFKTIGSATNTTRYIIGKVMVKNIYYDKRVTVRYTWNNWNTTNEVECLWLSNGDSVLPGTNMDVFHFLIVDTNKIDTVGKLEFCICYVTRNDRERLEFWDNNDGKNYKVEVVMNGFNNPFTL